MLFDTDPFRELERVRKEMDKLFSRSSFLGAVEPSFPFVNLYDETDNYLLIAEVPGVRKEDIAIHLHEDSLTISGQRTMDRFKGAQILRQEQPEGCFEKTIRLPGKVKDANIEATCEDGVLKIVLPKSDEAKPKRINIEG
jgi:HSP20 family protein